MKQLNFSYLVLGTAFLNNKIIKTTKQNDNVRILKSLLKSISKETFAVPYKSQEIKEVTNALTASKGRGEFEIYYRGYGVNDIKISLMHDDVLRMDFNDNKEVIFQYCGAITEKDIETITKAFKVLKYAKNIRDIRDSKMFNVLE